MLLSRKLWGEILLPIAVTVPSLIGLHLALAPPSQAQAALHHVSAQTVMGTADTGLYEIEIGENMPVNLSFAETGEVIQQLWLSDPSRVNVTFFGCLTSPMFGSSPCSGGQQGTQILQLSQLRQPLDFAENLTTVGDPTLTMITSGGAAGNSIYQIKLKLKGADTPSYATISVLPSAPPTPAQYQLVTHEYQQQVLSQLSKGLAIAEAEGLLDLDSTAYESLRSMIALMNGGTNFVEAINQTNTPRVLVDQVRSLAL